MLGIEDELVADGVTLVGLEVVLWALLASEEFLATDSSKRFFKGCRFSDPVDEVDGEPAFLFVGIGGEA